MIESMIETMIETTNDIASRRGRALLLIAALVLFPATGTVARAEPIEAGRLEIDPSTLFQVEIDGEQIWAFRRLPAESDFRFDSVFPLELREKLLTALAQLGEEECPEGWPLRASADSDCGFQDALDIGGLSIVEPPDPSSATSWTLMVDVPQKAQIDSLEIVLESDSCTGEPAAGGKGPQGGESVGTLEGLALPTLGSLDSVTFFLRCDGGPPPADSKDARALREAVAELLKMALNHHFLPGRVFPRKNVGALQQRIRRDLLLDGLDPPEVEVGFPTKEMNTGRIHVRGLWRVEAVSVEVVESQHQQDARGTPEFDLFKEKRRAAEERIALQYVLRSAFTDRIPLRSLAPREEEILEDLEEVRRFVGWKRSAEDNSAEDNSAEDNSAEDKLVAVVERRGTGTDLRLDARLGYSLEKGAYGAAEISYQHFVQDWTVRLELDGEEGEETRDFDLDFSWQQIDPRKRRHLGFSVDVSYHLDDSQPLGGPTEMSPEPETSVEEEVNQGRATFTFDYDSWNADHKVECALDLVDEGCGVHHVHQASLGFEVRDVKLTPETSTDLPAGPAAPDGQVDRWVLDTAHQVRFDRRARPTGLGALVLLLDTELQRAEDYFGGDFEFDRYQLALTAELFYGWVSRRDLLLRHTWSFGVASASTPLFEQFRLGGEKSVRGLEEGEAVGRSLYFERSELGILLERLLRRKKPEEQDSEDSQTAAADTVGNEKSQDGSSRALFDQLRTHTYLKVFYDRGGVADISSLSALRQSRDDFTGYGAAVELRGLNVGNRRGHLSLGYARSSDSRKSSGNVFVEFVLGLQ